MCMSGIAASGVILVLGHLGMPAHASSRGDGGVAAPGPDVTVSRIGLGSSGSCGSNDIAYYGQSGGISAFSMASTSCNVGTQTAEWINGGRNPVIAQNLYRYNSGRFEHIGMSWLKHSFCAVSEPTCGSCSATPCSSLGIGCADTYWATLNGDQSSLGPRWNKNPLGMGPSGVHNDIYQAPQGNATIRGRLQVKHTDIVPGSQYVAEIHYLTHDEPLANRYNNASYRLVNVTATAITPVANCQSSVVMGKPGIQAWRFFDPQVNISEVNDPEEGRFNVGYRVYDNGDGTWTYEYAVHNLNSRRGAGAISVPVEDGVTVSNIGFHSPAYHSGDGINYVTYDGTFWTGNHANDMIRWATTPFATNANANALRWGSLYNYRFTANTAPQMGAMEIELFLSGVGPSSFNAPVLVPGPAPAPPCPADLNGDDGVDVQDLLLLLGAWGPCKACDADLNSSGSVDVQDLLILLANWGPCN